jgi:hypothetical protein
LWNLHAGDDGMLFVYDVRQRRRAWPEGAAHQRDFYRVDVPGGPPSLAEDAFASMEIAAQ